MDGDVDRERRLAELDAAFHAMALEPRVGLTAAEVNAQWRSLSRQHHPDFGGSNDRMAQINAARDTILAEIEADGLYIMLLALRHQKAAEAAEQAIRAAANEDAPEFVAPDPPPPDKGAVPGFPLGDRMVIQIIVAVAGSGKTREWCRDVAADRLAQTGPVRADHAPL